MVERTDSKIVARKDDHIEVTALKFNGMIDSLEKFIDKLTKSVEIHAKIQGRKLVRDKDSEELSRTVFIATNQIMICLIVIDIPKT